jgi:hypothetical protein
MASSADLTNDTSEALYRAGQDAATAFLQTWDFDAYKAAFRSGLAQPTRREAVTSRMEAVASET